MAVFLRFPFEIEDSVKVCPLPDMFVDPINDLLRRFHCEELTCGSLVKIVGRLKLAGHVIHSKKGRVTKRNSYTVEFRECHQDQPSFGYVLLFVILECGQFAIIQQLTVEEWLLLTNAYVDDSMSDIFDTYSNLQKLIGEHIVPAQ
jgi:hypothetical protein